MLRWAVARILKSRMGVKATLSSTSLTLKLYTIILYKQRLIDNQLH